MKWSASWGSACDPCAKAKTRCIRSDGETCDRCQSLNLTCASQVRKPRKKRRRQTDSTIPDLAVPQPQQQNGSIHSTTESLQTHGAPPYPAAGTSAVANEGSQPDAAEPEPNVYVSSVKAERSGVFNVSTWLPGYYPFPSPTCTCLSEADGEDVPGPPESDEALLSIYRKRLSPQFPFVVIPDDITADELQKSRPFLAKVIKMVASLRNRRSMWNQSKAILTHISDAMLIRPDRSLDLLQGIVVFLGFYHYFCIAHGQFNHLTHMASSLIADMRLDRPRARPPPRKKHPEGMNPEEPRAMLNDERRAILAVWYINSCAAVVFGKVNSPGRHFTDHMERQVHELQERLEYGTDAILVQLIRGQRTNEMISQLRLSDQSVDIQPSSDVWAAKLDTLLADLEAQRSREPQLKIHRYLISSHRNYALLQLLEPQLLDISRFKNNEAVTALHHTPDYFRTASEGSKEAADTALREWFENWLTIPVCHFFYMPASGYLQLMGATVILLRRARLDLLARYRLVDAHPPETHINNDVNASREAVSGSDDLMLDLLERLASRLEEARAEMAAALCAEWANDFLNLIAWKLKERKDCIEKWENIIANEVQHHHVNARDGVDNGSSDRVGESGWDERVDLNATHHYQSMEEPQLWLDPLEELLLSGQAFESWLVS